MTLIQIAAIVLLLLVGSLALVIAHELAPTDGKDMGWPCVVCHLSATVCFGAALVIGAAIWWPV
jgi:hypothetical protein